MNIKKTIIAAFMALSATVFASGLYFVSGGDFRPCNFKYALRTTEPNQTLTITPNKVFPLSNFGNPEYAGEWSVKTMGEEFLFGKYDTIPDGSSLGGSGVQVEPLEYTFPAPGIHNVKIYDELGNIFVMNFHDNPNLVSVYIDWSSQKSVDKYSGYFSSLINNCANLKKIQIKFPYNGTEKIVMPWNSFNNLPNMEECVLTGTERFYSMNGCFQYNSATNAMYFPNVTNIQNGCFQNSPRVSYVSIPNVERIQGQALNAARDAANAPISNTEFMENNWGLKALRIGDRLKYIGQNSFWRQLNLTTIEFVTDEEDWIGTWNANNYLTQFFGVASAIDGVSDTATLTQLPTSEIQNSTYTELSARPKPTTLKLVRRNNQ